jgi:hypothetical protein
VGGPLIARPPTQPQPQPLRARAKKATRRRQHTTCQGGSVVSTPDAAALMDALILSNVRSALPLRANTSDSRACCSPTSRFYSRFHPRIPFQSLPCMHAAYLFDLPCSSRSSLRKRATRAARKCMCCTLAQNFSSFGLRQRDEQTLSQWARSFYRPAARR